MSSLPNAIIHSREGSIALGDLAGASVLGGRLESLRGRTVVLALREQLATAAALVERIENRKNKRKANF